MHKFCKNWYFVKYKKFQNLMFSIKCFSTSLCEKNLLFLNDTESLSEDSSDNLIGSREWIGFNQIQCHFWFFLLLFDGLSHFRWCCGFMDWGTWKRRLWRSDSTTGCCNTVKWAESVTSFRWGISMRFVSVFLKLILDRINIWIPMHYWLFSDHCWYCHLWWCILLESSGNGAIMSRDVCIVFRSVTK